MHIHVYNVVWASVISQGHNYINLSEFVETIKFCADVSQQIFYSQQILLKVGFNVRFNVLQLHGANKIFIDLL